MKSKQYSLFNMQTSKRLNTISTSYHFLTLQSFISLYLDYDDVMYSQTFNESLPKKSESLQYNPALAMTGQ